MTKKQPPNKGMEMRAKIEYIRGEYLYGGITLDEAKDRVQPLLDTMNADGRRIAKQFGKKFKPLTFGYVFR